MRRTPAGVPVYFAHRSGGVRCDRKGAFEAALRGLHDCISMEEVTRTAALWDKGLSPSLFEEMVEVLADCDLRELGRGLAVPTLVTVRDGGPEQAVIDASACLRGSILTMLPREIRYGPRRGAELRRLLDELLPEPEPLSPPAVGITPRELEILALLAEGLTNVEIAERLVVARPTVARHLVNIYAKLGVENRTQAAQRYASLQGRGRS